MASVSPARQAAFRILMEVERSQAHCDDLLRARFVNRMAPVDRNLTTALVLGTLRWQIRLDAALKYFLAKPNAKLDAEVRIALRLGALQLLHMERIPAHAAIAESVELAKLAGHSFAARMVNAVLRKLAQQGSEGSVSRHDLSSAEQCQTIVRKDSGDNPASTTTRTVGEASVREGAEQLAQTYAHPVWLVERWIQQYGAVQAEALCAHGQRQPALHLRIADHAAEEELLAQGIQIAPATLLVAARTLVAGDLVSTRCIREGRIRMQDEGSQLVGELAAACSPAATKKICDACAAPGGKTLILAERHTTASIVACEQSTPRAEELALRLAPLSPRVSCRNLDACTLAPSEGFDLILVDAPCSGTGTMGRNPEIRHRLQAGEFARQAERQSTLLAAALRAVRPGGRVLYSTCSLEQEENDDVVARALGAHPAARQLSLGPVLNTLVVQGVLMEGALSTLQGTLTPEGALRLLPGLLPTDGFFVALLERVD